MARSSLILSVGAFLLSHVSATTYRYTLADTYQGADFFGKFNFFTDPDPTNGHVQYVSEAAARDPSLNLILGESKWGVETQFHQPNGRPSIRLESKTSYTHGLFLADIKHMPGSICGVWPAFWTLGSGVWPGNGEVDIIEGVNQQKHNQFSAHTSDNCVQTFSSDFQSGAPIAYDCAYSTGGGTGCSSGSNAMNDYGDDFNAHGGGVYAMQWTSDFIKVWFFPRRSIPDSITQGSPDLSLFGTPQVMFSGNSCNIDSHFKDHRLVFDTTFCGQWAGQVYGNTMCPNSAQGWAGCNAYVANNPGDFVEAYWEVNSIQVFKEETPSSSSVAHSTSTVAPSSAVSSRSIASSFSSVFASSASRPSALSSTSIISSRLPASSSSAAPSFSAAPSSSAARSSSAAPSFSTVPSSSAARSSAAPSSSTVPSPSAARSPSAIPSLSAVSSSSTVPAFTAPSSVHPSSSGSRSSAMIQSSSMVLSSIAGHSAIPPSTVSVSLLGSYISASSSPTVVRSSSVTHSSSPKSSSTATNPSSLRLYGSFSAVSSHSEAKESSSPSTSALRTPARASSSSIATFNPWASLPAPPRSSAPPVSKAPSNPSGGLRSHHPVPSTPNDDVSVQNFISIRPAATGASRTSNKPKPSGASGSQPPEGDHDHNSLGNPSSPVPSNRDQSGSPKYAPSAAHQDLPAPSVSLAPEQGGHWHQVTESSGSYPLPENKPKPIFPGSQSTPQTSDLSESKPSDEDSEPECLEGETESSSSDQGPASKPSHHRQESHVLSSQEGPRATNQPGAGLASSIGYVSREGLPAANSVTKSTLTATITTTYVDVGPSGFETKTVTQTVTYCPAEVTPGPLPPWVTTTVMVCENCAATRTTVTLTRPVSPVQITQAPLRITSTIYSTVISTITSCPPTVKNCPAGTYVTTVTKAVATTVVPVVNVNIIAQTLQYSTTKVVTSVIAVVPSPAAPHQTGSVGAKAGSSSSPLYVAPGNSSAPSAFETTRIKPSQSLTPFKGSGSSLTVKSGMFTCIVIAGALLFL